MYQLGKLFGIRIRVHWLFLAMLGIWLLFGGGLGTVVLVCCVFFFVVLHELSHSLVARLYGIRVRDIILLPIGGVARLEGRPPSPKAEFWIALAGPLLNLVLALVLLPVAMAVGAGGVALGWNVLDSLAQLLGVLFAINLGLALFNLLPGFPMDGGRILRAYLAKRVGMLEATGRAARTGRYVALLMAVAGVVLLRPMLLFIALFVWLAGRQEEAAVRLRYAQAPTVELHPRYGWRYYTGLDPRDGPTGIDPRVIDEMLQQLKRQMERETERR